MTNVPPTVLPYTVSIINCTQIYMEKSEMPRTWLQIQDLKVSKIAFLGRRNPTQTKTCKLITMQVKSRAVRSKIFETHEVTPRIIKTAILEYQRY